MARPARRWIRWLLAGIAAAFVAIAVLVTWLVTTEAGLRRAVALVERVGPVTIHVEGASGRLIGPLHIQSVAIEHPRASIRVTGLEADYEPLEILAGRITADGAHIADASVALHPPTGPPKPPSFMPGWLSVVVHDVAVSRFRLLSPTGTEVLFEDIRGSATISKSRIDFDGVHVKSPGWAVAGASGSLFARDPIGLDVNTAWLVSDQSRVAGIAHAVGDLDRLLVESRVMKPGTGRVTAEVLDLSGNLHWQGNAEIDALDLTQWVAEPPVGPLSASLAIEGDKARYSATGSVRGRGLPEAGVKVDGRARYANQVVTFDALTLESAPGRIVHAHGTLAVADEPAYDVAASWTNFRWPLVGDALIESAQGDLTAQGWTEFDYRVNGDFAPAAGPPISGSAAGRFATEAISVDESDLGILGGRVALKGSLGRGDAAPWSVSGHAAGINPAKLRPELPGRLAFDFAAGGTGFGEHAPWHASINKLSGPFRGQPASGQGGVRSSAGQFEFQDVALALGPSRLQADGILGHGAKLDARVESDDLSAVLPELGGRVDATVAVREQAIAIAFTGHDLAYGSHRAVVLSADAHIDREGKQHSWLRLRSSGITVAGFPVTDTRLSLDGLTQQHTLDFRVGIGQDSVSLRGRGALVDGRYTLDLDRIEANGPRLVPWQLQAASSLTVAATDAALTPMCIAYEARRICLEGRWKSGGDWMAQATTEAFPLEALATQRLGAPRYRGLLVINAKASAKAGQPWVADVRAEIRDGALDYQSASGADRTVSLGLTRLTLVSDAARHRVDLRVSDAADLDLAVELEATRLPDKNLGDLPVTGSVHGKTRQLALLPLLVDPIDNASGELALDFSVAGRVAAPVLQGEAKLSQGALDFYQTNLRLRDLDATVRLEETSLALDAKGKAGEGTLAVDGRLGWKDRKLAGTLNVSGDRLLVANVPEARVFASPDLKFRLQDHAITVNGDVLIPEARIVPADTANAVLPSSDERIVVPEAAPGEATPFEVSSDIRLSLGDKVQVKAYGLSATVTGAVRARSSPRESTTGSGELEVKEGEYKAYGRELEVERGRLVFTGGPVTDPGVDLRASRELPGYKVGVIARGPLRKPQLTLFSEPSLPQAQIASMLIVGRSSIQGDPGAESSDLSTTEEGGAFLAGQFGKYVGLDDVGVTQDADTGAEVVLGKYLSPRLYVSYGISLAEEINTLKLRYTIGDRWTLSAESGLEQAFDVEYRIED